MPVRGAGRGSYDQHSFWAYPWGESVTHKGVDIFARRGTPVEAATGGLVVYSGTNRLGGRVVLVLGPRWRTHYYAHLDSINVRSFSFVSRGRVLGTVGATGNAAGKPAHLHYSIKTLVPYPWQNDKGRQGARRMFYVNPVPLLNKAVRVRSIASR
ncbi:MAG: M23 family metallopeptidase [Chitinophagaceae bacterium]|nr:MAG: M23 family metallopeptidase [Chitinophagaceae bacterium]